jgi:hypothetical protein
MTARVCKSAKASSNRRPEKSSPSATFLHHADIELCHSTLDCC